MSKSGLDADRGAGAGRSRGATRGAERGGQAHASRETQAQQDTRSKLVDAAIRVFAREGFAAASTRMIAAESGVNLQAITYYFGGKG